jgi:hypothetical protein
MVDNLDYKSLPVQFEMLEEVKDDSRFTPVKVWIAHTGKNLNKSFFTKELLEGMIPTLAYIPIVGFIQTDNTNKDDFLGHEERYIVTVDGVETEYLGRMYGFIPKEHNARFESKTVNGVTREYLVADGIISNKFSKSKEIFDRDMVKGQSMELERETINGYFDNDNDQFVFTEARFEALCILGDKKIPAMTGGSIEKIQFSSMKAQIEELVDELKLEFEFKKGGDCLDMLKELEGMIENYSHVSAEFVEDLKTKLDTFETVELLQEALQEEENKQFALTVEAQMTFLRKAVKELEVYTDDWGYRESRYYMKDAKLDEMKVYCRDYKDWSDVGFSFTKNGEEFVIDKESAFKVAWQPVEIGQETMVSFDVVEDEKNAVEFFANKLEEKETQIKSEYETKIDEAKAEVKDEYDAQIEKLNSELEELKSYKYEIEKATKTDYVNAVENLTDEEREELVAKVDDYTIESLTDEVAKIVGKKSIKFSTNSTKVVDNINTNFDYNKKPQRAYYHLMDKK